MLGLLIIRSFNSVAVVSLKQPWNKRQREIAERKAAKYLEREMKETARLEKEVMRFCARIALGSFDHTVYRFKLAAFYFGNYSINI